jgi:hypothetical protein
MSYCWYWPDSNMLFIAIVMKHILLPCFASVEVSFLTSREWLPRKIYPFCNLFYFVKMLCWLVASYIREFLSFCSCTHVFEKDLYVKKKRNTEYSFFHQCCYLLIWTLYCNVHFIFIWICWRKTFYSKLSNGYPQAVRKDNKQRFSLIEENGELLIRANQGHTTTVKYRVYYTLTYPIFLLNFV